MTMKVQNNMLFSYAVTIENNSLSTIQLISRYWLIKDALNHPNIVKGPGVIGQQPIIQPGTTHQYNSGCLLVSPFGSMQGYYKMVSEQKSFRATIPLFKLSAPFVMN